LAGHAPQQFTQGEHGFVVVDDILEPEQVGLLICRRAMGCEELGATSRLEL